MDGAEAPDLPYVRFDGRTEFHRAPAHCYVAIREACVEGAIAVDDQVAPEAFAAPIAPTCPELRPYQAQAIAAFERFGSRGVVALPTGSGKTRVACAAIVRAKSSAAVLVPTRALLEQWVTILQALFGSPIGAVGDGAMRIESITVMTFESAYRRLDVYGHRFGMVIVDEVHHFGGGLRAEALEMSAAPIRMGLTATPPACGSIAAERIRELVGPIVFELAIADLAGSDLAALDLVRLHVALSPRERAEYERQVDPFRRLRGQILRSNPDADWVTCIRAIARMPEGTDALAGMHRACALATFPAAKRVVVRELLARHRLDRTLIFTATAEEAYAMGVDGLIPVITAHVARTERERILAAFREGRVRAICSAQVLNEGLDVPEASVAVIVGGSLGAREHVQRVGRVLRPAAGKRATVYELVTLDTLDEARTRA
ncbi:MAG: DEAD/DEAH box helicase family protein, partial [Polyangiales bacterium]